MNEMLVDFPVAPAGARMPPGAQHGFLIFALIGSLLVTIYSIYQARRYRSALPLWYALAAICTVALEPLTNYLGMVLHPAVGQFSAFKTLDRMTPWHIVFLYPLYFSLPIVLFGKFVNRSLTSRDVWKMYPGFVIFSFLLEIVPLQTGLWLYYGNQGLWFWSGGPPGFVALMNPVMCLIPFMIQYAAVPYLTGWRQFMIVPLNIATACGGYVASQIFWIEAVNSRASASAVQLAAIVSVGAGLMLLWLGGRILIDAEHSGVALQADAIS